jgi:hypothetical protein
MIEFRLILRDAEAMALAQLCKRFTHDDAVRFSNRHDGGGGCVRPAAGARGSGLCAAVTSARVSNEGARLFSSTDSIQHVPVFPRQLGGQ